MPFTLAHPAAVLPFRRVRLLPMAPLVVGAMAPDFEYLARLRPIGSLMHSPLGALTVAVPVAMLLGWFAESYFLPDLRRRLQLAPRATAPAGVVACLLAAVLGVATHLLWDAFTHAGGFMVGVFGVLSAETFSGIPVFKVLQHGSTAVGFIALAAVLGPKAFALEPGGRIALCRLLVAGGVAGTALGAANAFRATTLPAALGQFAVGFLIGLLVLALLLPVLPARRAGLKGT